MSCTTETAGWCGTHRTVFTWRNKPYLMDALCPVVGCGLPLVRRPRGNIGRHVVVNQQPLTRIRKPLEMRPVED